jgi:hypothetical protein
MTTPVHRLRMFMAGNLGRILSSEMAAQLEAEVFGTPTPLPKQAADAQDGAMRTEPQQITRETI